MSASRAEARALLHAFFLAHPEGDSAAFRGLRARHPDQAAELDRLHAEVAELRLTLPLSPASILGGLEEDAPVPPFGRRRPRLQGFEVADELGHGGMGVVWRSHDVELGRTVAVKVLHEKLIKNEDALKRFVNEARITGQLQHPGIVPVYRIGVAADGRPFMSMKLVKGRTLAQLLSLRSSVEDRALELLTVFARICDAVGYAHSRGVVHRDLKPSNVMVGRFGEVQVLDWGLAKVLGADEEGAEASAITPASEGHGDSVAGAVIGTPLYMAPEQAAGMLHRVDQRSDVFSLGAVLCELLTGRPPYPPGRSNVPWQVGAPLQGAYERLDASDADRELVKLARACLAEDPDDRPPDAGSIVSTVSEYLASVDRRARAAELEAAGARARADQERRARRQAVVLGSCIIAALLVASLAVRQVWRHRVLAAERTAGTVDRARSLFDEAEYAASAEAAFEALAGEGQLTGAAELEMRQLAKNAELMASLRRDRPAVVIHELDEAEHLRLRARFRAAFRAHGMDVLESGTTQAASYLKEAGVGELVRPMLDCWARTEQSLGGFDSSNARRLLALAAALDDDESRRELREVISNSRDVGEIRAFLGPELGPGLDPSTLMLVLQTLSRLYGHPAKMGDISDARQAALRIHERYPDDVEVLVQLGSICFGLGRRDLLDPDSPSFFREAIEHLGAACALDPQHAPARALLGAAYRHLGDERMSEATFSQALRHMRDGNREGNRALSRIMFLLNSTNQVIAHLEVLLEEEPAAADLWCELAWNLCLSQSRPEAERAVAVARRAIELRPDVNEYRHILALALYFTGEYGELLDLLASLPEKKETAHEGLMRAIALHELGLEDDAARLGPKMLRRTRANPSRFLQAVEERGRQLFGG